MIVVTLGPAGTFSDELAHRLFREEPVLLPTIRSICARVAEGGCTGIVPIENSEAGGVGPTLDCLQRFAVYIVGEAYLPIRHHLAAWGMLEQVRVIYAHPQTHEQCSDLLDTLALDVIHTSSNAQSALSMLENPASGAVVSEELARRYHLPIQRKDIQNNPNNITRFVLLSNAPCSGAATKCSILIDPHTDRAGLLYDLLGVFARRGINLTRIESRPSKRGMGNYVFFIDFLTDPGWEEALADLTGITPVKRLGCYGRVEAG
ncbi:MAG: ACT domain-containing protein [Methanomicrobiales archaeon]|nr:ACT domain-containing protein [Methanomicrobiales archaeon]